MQYGAAAFVGGAGGEEEEAGEQGDARSEETARDGDDDAGCGESDGESEEAAGGLVIAEDAGDDGEQQRKEWRPVEIDVGIGAEGKVVLDGNEVQVKRAELVEGMRHGHAAGAGPALVVAVEAEMEEPGVEDDEGECGDCQPECGGLEQVRTPGGFNSGIQTTVSS